MRRSAGGAAAGAGAGAGRRPDGTDGSDFSFRMTVDDKYKKLAEYRGLLRRLVSAQTFYTAVRGAWALVFLAQGKRAVGADVVAMLAFGAAASWLGTMSLKGTRPLSTRVYLLFTCVALGLATWPLLGSATYSQLSELQRESQLSGDMTDFALAALELAQDVVGVLAHATAAYVTFCILYLTAAGKKAG